MLSLNQVTVPSSDINVSIEFYQQLGLILIVHSTDRYARFLVPANHATFSIHKVEEKIEGDGIWVYFEVENLDNYVEVLVQKGLSFSELPTDKPWLWREARINDPYGNQIILYRAGKNRIDPPWKLKLK